MVRHHRAQELEGLWRERVLGEGGGEHLQEVVAFPRRAPWSSPMLLVLLM
jgi:hypothetical protein